MVDQKPNEKIPLKKPRISRENTGKSISKSYKLDRIEKNGLKKFDWHREANNKLKKKKCGWIKKKKLVFSSRQFGP